MMLMTEAPTDLLADPGPGYGAELEWEEFDRVAALPAGAWTAVAVDVELRAQVQQRTLAHLGRKTAAELRRYVSRLLTRLDPDGAQRRARAARDDTDVTLQPQPDGMALVCAQLPVEDAVTVKSAADAYAATAKNAGDPRRTGVLRGELLARLCSDYLTGTLGPLAGQGGLGGAPRAGGRPIEIGITVDLATALGRRDLPGEIPGIGIVPREVIAQMIQREQAKLRLLVIDTDTGRLMHRATDSYRPTPDQIPHVRATYVGSVGPGRQVPSERTDHDHVTPHPDGDTVIG